VVAKPLLQSHRYASLIPFGINDFKREVPAIREFLTTPNRSVRFAGTEELVTDVDAIVFATDYLYSYPFLSSLLPAIVLPTGGQRTYHTYGQLFYTPHLSLTLLALPERAVPWTVIESQAAVVARA
jgi:hypothetical protein